MLKIYSKAAEDESFTQLETAREGSWIHVDEATQEDLQELASLTELAHIDLHDCLDRYEVPRIERVRSHVLIFTRHPIELESGLYTTTLTIILTPHYIVTICPQKSSLIENFLTQKTNVTTAEQPKLLIHLLLKITQEFTLQIKKVRYNVLKQEKEMASVESDDIAILTKNEEILNQYAAALSPFHEVLEEMSTGKYASLHENDHDLLEDLLNAVKQSELLCTNNLKSIRSLRDSYQIIFTNNLHKTIKLLTSLTIILNIPTMIASLYGMNVNLPLASKAHAFSLILALIAVLSLGGLYIFQRKRWL